MLLRHEGQHDMAAGSVDHRRLEADTEMIESQRRQPVGGHTHHHLIPARRRDHQGPADLDGLARQHRLGDMGDPTLVGKAARQHVDHRGEPVLVLSRDLLRISFLDQCIEHASRRGSWQSQFRTQLRGGQRFAQVEQGQGVKPALQGTQVLLGIGGIRTGPPSPPVSRQPNPQAATSVAECRPPEIQRGVVRIAVNSEDAAHGAHKTAVV